MRQTQQARRGARYCGQRLRQRAAGVLHQAAQRGIQGEDAACQRAIWQARCALIHSDFKITQPVDAGRHAQGRHSIRHQVQPLRTFAAPGQGRHRRVHMHAIRDQPRCNPGAGQQRPRQPGVTMPEGRHGIEQMCAAAYAGGKTRQRLLVICQRVSRADQHAALGQDADHIQRPGQLRRQRHQAHAVLHAPPGYGLRRRQAHMRRVMGALLRRVEERPFEMIAQRDRSMPAGRRPTAQHPQRPLVNLQRGRDNRRQKARHAVARQTRRCFP